MTQEINFWMRVEILNLPFKPFGVGDVISIHPGHILTSSLCDAVIESDRQTSLLAFINHPDPGILELLDNTRRRISGCIIHKKEFPIDTGLPQDRTDRGSDGFLAIMNRHRDRN